jgi:hypothetical protein
VSFYFSWLEMLVKLVFNVEPIVLTTAMIAIEMPAAIKRPGMGLRYRSPAAWAVALATATEAAVVLLSAARGEAVKSARSLVANYAVGAASIRNVLNACGDLENVVLELRLGLYAGRPEKRRCNVDPQSKSDCRE